MGRSDTDNAEKHNDELKWPPQTCAIHGASNCPDGACPGILQPAPPEPVDSHGEVIEGADAAERFMQAAQEMTLNGEQRAALASFDDFLARERDEFAKYWEYKFPGVPVPKR